ncbi:MAG: LEA type 2 family protein [Motiliproteus sp.]
MNKGHFQPTGTASQPFPAGLKNAWSRGIALLLTLMLLHGCASLQPNFENPTVTINSFEVLPSSGMLPRFAIGLHVINPNRTPLTLQGLVYTVAIEDHKILTGVANDLPKIEAYGEGDIRVEASVDLLEGLGLLSGLMRQQQGSSVEYTLNARLNVSNLLPDIEISDSGQIDLAAAMRPQ